MGSDAVVVAVILVLRQRLAAVADLGEPAQGVELLQPQVAAPVFGGAGVTVLVAVPEGGDIAVAT